MEIALGEQQKKIERQGKRKNKNVKKDKCKTKKEINANKGMTAKSEKVTRAADEEMFLYFLCGFKLELGLQQ